MTHQFQRLTTHRVAGSHLHQQRNGRAGVPPGGIKRGHIILRGGVAGCKPQAGFKGGMCVGDLMQSPGGATEVVPRRRVGRVARPAGRFLEM